MSTRIVLVLPFVLTLTAAQALGRPPQAWSAAEEKELTPPFGSQRLGSSVAIAGDTLVAGAEMGSKAFVFVRNGSTWTQQAVLVAPDTDTPDKLGCAVAISGDSVLVGARDDSVSSKLHAGSAHVFVRNGSTWGHQAMLVPPEHSHLDEFGTSVALFGDTAVVGMPNDTTDGVTNAGSAHVFVRSAGVWSYQQKLVGLDTSFFDRFGAGVAMFSDTLVVGAPDEDNQGGEAAGSAYVFTRSGATWSQQAKLTASDGQPFAVLGRSLSLSGDTLLAGAANAGTPGEENGEGRAYVFVRQGTTWTQQANLQASDGTDGNWFGEGVALSGDVALVGSYRDGQVGPEAGAAYVFARQGAAWSEELKLQASDGASGDWFGAACALSGDTAVFGAPKHGHGLTWTGAAYVLRLLECPASVPFAEVVRLGSPPNPAALAAGQTSGPVLGAVWDPVIDHTGFMPAAALDFLGVSTTATSIPSGIGTLLCGTSPLLVVASPAPGAPFQIQIPFACAPAGLALCAQGASVDAGGALALTNALDIVIGTF